MKDGRDSRWALIKAIVADAIELAPESRVVVVRLQEVLALRAQQQVAIRRIDRGTFHAGETGEVGHEAFLLTRSRGVSTSRLATMMTVEIAGRIGVIS